MSTDIKAERETSYPLAANSSPGAWHVPYGDIDVEIREIVRLLNESWSVRTTWSCSGHEEGDEGYISFCADTQNKISSLILSLPFFGCRAGFVANRPVAKFLWMTVNLLDDNRIQYDLRFSAYPSHARKELIEEIEKSLKRASKKHDGKKRAAEPMAALR